MDLNTYDLAIVIPAYKNTFIRDTLESIANQTDKRFTLYIGDDNSPNHLAQIIDDFKNKIPIVYNRFDYNLGGVDLVGHWERCIAMTRSEPYIWLFSDDDTMDEKCVECFYRHREESPKENLLHFNIRMIDEYNDAKITELPIFPSQMNAGNFLEAKLKGKIVSYVVEFIFSRELYEAVGGFESYDLAWGADFMTWIKMSMNSFNGINTIEGRGCKVNWRRSRENISPNMSHPITIRKIRSLIDNAAFLKNMMRNNPSAFLPLKLSFRWLRFPLGEIYRNRKKLSWGNIYTLLMIYKKKVGFKIHY